MRQQIIRVERLWYTIDSVLVLATHIVQDIHWVYLQKPVVKNCEFGHGKSMELLLRFCLTLLGTYLSISLLQYECVSTKFYLLISICFNQLLHIYVSWMYYHFLQNRVHMIRTIFASTVSLILYFSRKPIVIHCFIENLKSQIAWNHGDDWSPHCGLCIFSSKVVIFKLHKENILLFKNYIIYNYA